MTDKLITVREKLGLKDFNAESFDPMNIEISEIKLLYESMPRDGNVDVHIARKLALQYLRAADRCSEILATLTLWEQTAEDRKKQTFSLAFLNAKEGDKKVTDLTAKHMAECNKEYLGCCKVAREAKTVRKRFEDMHDHFIKGHHLMKDRIKGEEQLQKISNFQYGEGSWSEQ